MSQKVDINKLLENVNELSKLNAQEFGKIEKQEVMKTEHETDAHAQQRQLKMERERLRAE